MRCLCQIKIQIQFAYTIYVIRTYENSTAHNDDYSFISIQIYVIVLDYTQNLE